MYWLGCWQSCSRVSTIAINVLIFQGWFGEIWGQSVKDNLSSFAKLSKRYPKPIWFAKLYVKYILFLECPKSQHCVDLSVKHSSLQHALLQPQRANIPALFLEPRPNRTVCTLNKFSIPFLFRSREEKHSNTAVFTRQHHETFYPFWTEANIRHLAFHCFIWEVFYGLRCPTDGSQCRFGHGAVFCKWSMAQIQTMKAL